MLNHTTVRSDELAPGMIVNCHGMRCMIDRPIRTRPSQNGGESTPVTVYSTNALVLNRDDVPTTLVPLSYTSTASYPSRGLPAEPEGTHRWAIQGADFVTWAVETDSLPEEGAGTHCQHGVPHTDNDHRCL